MAEFLALNPTSDDEEIELEFFLKVQLKFYL